ncbi:MAG: hypothetical protein M1827_006096 [Pycnora praestabilis]|nr:MAG: hypothetical protein M1827_006096 [Pycnora praestabilis]
MFTSLIITTFATAVLGHMQLNYPPPFNATNNPHTTGPGDPLLQYPFLCCGRNLVYNPCKGYLSMLDTPEGASVATWAAGSTQNFSISGTQGTLGGTHYGGSCQVGFSVDKGKTFQVATSWEGNCPHRTNGISPDGQVFPFTVPADLPTGDAVFAWTWFNREQEFNMNCAAVTITGGTGGAAAVPAPASAPLGAPGNDSAPAAAATPSPASASTGATPVYTTEVILVTPRSNPVRGLFNNILPPVPIPVVERQASPPVSYSQRPVLLIADVNNGCETPKTTAEVKYPNPGPDVVPGDGAYPLALPSGSC